MEMTPASARTFWKALMDNATGLVVDAHTLSNAGSFGRARSLMVLAQEELGKALWIYETFEEAWSTGDETPLQVPRLKTHGKHHVTKYMDAFVFGQDLKAFWGDYDYGDLPGNSQEEWDAYFAKRRKEAEAEAYRANQEKMDGFYVDADASTGEVSSPAGIGPGTIEADLQTASQVIEMLLIQDNSRMQQDAQTPFDSTHAQQHRLLPISHPEDWAAASEAFRAGAYFRPSEVD